MKRTLLAACMSVFCISITINAQNFAIQNIDPNTGEEPYEIASGDLDGDGDMDIVMATYNYNGGTPVQDYIKWYSNDGSGAFSIETTVSSTIRWVDGLIIADIDGQFGDDIIATSVNQNKLVYFLSDGLGGFGSEITVDATIGGPGQVVSGDINNDGNIDLISVSYNNNRTQWYSGDGAGNFVTETDIENGTTDGPYYVDIADFDGDTDLDIVVGFFNSQSIEIYYNQYIESGSTTVSWIKDTVSVDTGGTYLFVVTVGDVNNDGNINVVSVDFSAGEVKWFNKIKNGASTASIICDDTIINNPGSVFIADLDNDMLNDIIVTDGGAADDAMIWFKGASNASPSTTPTLVINNNYQMFDITVEDFDGDLDQDIATIGNFSDTVDWYENDLFTLSMSEPTIENINVYPNPARDILNFNGLSNEYYTVSVYDLLGKNILNANVNSDSGINVSQLNSGMYIIKFENNNTTYKFIKE